MSRAHLRKDGQESVGCFCCLMECPWVIREDAGLPGSLTCRQATLAEALRDVNVQIRSSVQYNAFKKISGQRSLPCVTLASSVAAYIILFVGPGSASAVPVS